MIQHACKLQSVSIEEWNSVLLPLPFSENKLGTKANACRVLLWIEMIALWKGWTGSSTLSEQNPDCDLGHFSVVDAEIQECLSSQKKKRLDYSRFQFSHPAQRYLSSNCMTHFSIICWFVKQSWITWITWLEKWNPALFDTWAEEWGVKNLIS